MNSVTGPSSAPLSTPARQELARRPLVVALAAIVCGLGLAAAGITLVRATGYGSLLDMIWSGSPHRTAEPAPAPSRPADPPSEPVVVKEAEVAPVRREVRRKARAGFAAANARVLARTSLCVRSCDGYAFPFGALASARHVPPSDGSPQAHLKMASLVKTSRVSSCSCVGPDKVGRIIPIALDPTLRTGTATVDAEPGPAPDRPASSADARRSRSVASGIRRGEAPLRAGVFAEIKAPAGSGAGVRAFQARSDVGRPDASGARIIDVR